MENKTTALVGYTREQVEQMPAGREMDGLIAEKLFGYKRSNYGGLTIFETPEYQRLEATGSVVHVLGQLATLEDVPGGREAVLRGYKHKLPFSRCIDFYSTDIAAAWQVVEAMQKIGMFFYLQDGPKWRADFLGKGKEERSKAETAPLAICRASLLANLNSMAGAPTKEGRASHE